ncbi:AAA family ATPase [Stenotrophomonas sp. 364]|uniref:AAA family ATPase n=1 Tax=Stenotrophomonas sp. 364 TaxID=2691571 RepID=UPI0013175D23|nr:AAA family ATPase [Stenotrophomonas sp. 364]QHB72915.1 AAA family ATPase [Stenotrophomonas sp. 364]
METAPPATAAPPVPTEITADAVFTLRERVRMIAEAGNGYSQARIAKESAISGATLSQFLAGSYAGNIQAVARKVQVWLDHHQAKANGETLPAAPHWVDTPTSRRIINDLRYAQLAADLVLIVGSAGVGKTKAIARYQTLSPNVWHVEMSAATASLLRSLEEIALRVGIKEPPIGAAALQRAIAARIGGCGGLLVIDEAQHLTVQALDQVRWFNDKCAVGVVLCGNDRVYTQMTGGNRAAHLDRLYSRVGKKTHLKRACVGDADALIKAWGIDDSRCHACIRRVAMRPGALRALNKVLRLAATYAQASRKRLDAEVIDAAALELGVFE